MASKGTLPRALLAPTYPPPNTTRELLPWGGVGDGGVGGLHRALRP